MDTGPRAGVEADRLRSAMGRFTTGVTVVTSRDNAGRPFRTTANAGAARRANRSDRPPCELCSTLMAKRRRWRSAPRVSESRRGQASTNAGRNETEVTGSADDWTGELVLSLIMS